MSKILWANEMWNSSINILQVSCLVFHERMKGSNSQSNIKDTHVIVLLWILFIHQVLFLSKRCTETSVSSRVQLCWPITMQNFSSWFNSMDMCVLMIKSGGEILFPDAYGYQARILRVVSASPSVCVWGGWDGDPLCFWPGSFIVLQSLAEVTWHPSEPPAFNNNTTLLITDTSIGFFFLCGGSWCRVMFENHFLFCYYTVVYYRNYLQYYGMVQNDYILYYCTYYSK